MGIFFLLCGLQISVDLCCELNAQRMVMNKGGDVGMGKWKQNRRKFMVLFYDCFSGKKLTRRQEFLSRWIISDSFWIVIMSVTKMDDCWMMLLNWDNKLFHAGTWLASFESISEDYLFAVLRNWSIITCDKNTSKLSCQWCAQADAFFNRAICS